MKKFVLLWHLNSSKVPFTLRRRTRSALMAQVKKDVTRRVVREWGSFVNDTGGYVVAEGIEPSVVGIVNRYRPFVSFQLHPIASVS